MTTTKPPTAQGISALLDEQDARLRELRAEAQRVQEEHRQPEMLGRYQPGWTTWPQVAAFAAAGLRDIAAKRKIVALCETETDETGGRPLAIRIMSLLAGVYEDTGKDQR